MKTVYAVAALVWATLLTLVQSLHVPKLFDSHAEKELITSGQLLNASVNTQLLSQMSLLGIAILNQKGNVQLQATVMGVSFVGQGIQVFPQRETPFFFVDTERNKLCFDVKQLKLQFFFRARRNILQRFVERLFVSLLPSAVDVVPASDATGGYATLKIDSIHIAGELGFITEGSLLKLKVEKLVILSCNGVPVERNSMRTRLLAHLLKRLFTAGLFGRWLHSRILPLWTGFEVYINSLLHESFFISDYEIPYFSGSPFQMPPLVPWLTDDSLVLSLMKMHSSPSSFKAHDKERRAIMSDGAMRAFKSHEARLYPLLSLSLNERSLNEFKHVIAMMLPNLERKIFVFPASGCGGWLAINELKFVEDESIHIDSATQSVRFSLQTGLHLSVNPVRGNDHLAVKLLKYSSKYLFPLQFEQVRFSVRIQMTPLSELPRGRPTVEPSTGIIYCTEEHLRFADDFGFNLQVLRVTIKSFKLQGVNLEYWPQAMHQTIVGLAESYLKGYINQILTKALDSLKEKYKSFERAVNSRINFPQASELLMLLPRARVNKQSKVHIYFPGFCLYNPTLAHTNSSTLL